MAEDSRDVVYIVDSDVAVRQALARLIDAAGLEARPCESALAFLRRRRGAACCCALIDVAGLLSFEPDAWARLRAAAQAIPVIALSADDDATTQRLARAMGARAFFRKPVDAAALLDSIAWLMHADGSG